MSEADVKVDAAITEKAEEIAAEKTELAAAIVETSQQRAENAEAVAQAISDATVMTELGRRVEMMERNCVQWQEENAALRSKLTVLEATITDLSAKLPPNLIAPVVEAPNPSSTNSPIRPSQPEKTEVVLATNPDEGGDPGEVKTPPKKKRFAL